jgi:hypothetical protein
MTTSKTPQSQLSIYDIIGVMADVQTSYTDNYKALEGKYHWKAIDARLQVFFQCFEVAGNARLSIALIAFAKGNGLDTKEWWGKWACYDHDRAFNRWPHFKTFVDDKSRQFIHRAQEQMLVSIQIYIESFLRNLARQFKVDPKEFWKLKSDFMQAILGLTAADLVPLTVYQHLRNSLHNKGIHHNVKYPDMTFDVGGFVFHFRHGQPVKISWEHIRELQIANSNLLLKICEHTRVDCLPPVDAQNIVVLTDEPE